MSGGAVVGAGIGLAGCVAAGGAGSAQAGSAAESAVEPIKAIVNVFNILIGLSRKLLLL